MPLERRDQSTENGLPTGTQKVTLTVLCSTTPTCLIPTDCHVAPTEIGAIKGHFTSLRTNGSDRIWAAFLSHVVYLPPEPNPILSLLYSELLPAQDSCLCLLPCSGFLLLRL